MLKPARKYPHANHKSPLAQWVYKTVWLRGLKVKFRLQGNNLHILCDGESCPDQAILLTRLLLSLQQIDLNTLIPPDQPPIYQIFLYARRTGQDHQTWTAPIYLNQIDRHLEQLRQQQTATPQSSAIQEPVLIGPPAQTASSHHPVYAEPSSSSALVLSNRSLARQGNPEGIARYLSETLSALGIAVKVNVKTLPYRSKGVRVDPPLQPLPTLNSAEVYKRLWIVCEAFYSPDPMIIGEPVARQLRELELEGCRDAIILIQVRGEAEPDWFLRVDLTPTTEMLREWSRWGDVEAIARLLKPALSDRDIELSTSSLQDATLHLCCSIPTKQSLPSHQQVAPDQETVRNIALPILEALGPQGVHAAAIYGQSAGQAAPAWVEWLNLPAAKHPALAKPAKVLAKQGDWEAIAFLLSRLLNPDLDDYLATGGIRIQFLLKQDLLHVMTDAPICPRQNQVGPKVAQFLQQLHLPEVAGVRVYGRRAGQKRPLWSYGTDFVPRQRLVPEATPEFAATDAYIGELIAQSGEQILRSDLTADDLENAWKRLRQGIVQGIQRVLIGSQLFTLIPEAPDVPIPPPSRTVSQDAGIAFIWATVGVLLAVQLGWGLNRLLPSPSELAVAEVQPASTPLSSPSMAAPSPTPIAPSPIPTPSQTATPGIPTPPSPFNDLNFRRETKNTPAVFNPSSFTQANGDSSDGDIPATSSIDSSPEAVSNPADTAPKPTAQPADLPYIQRSPEVQSIAASILAADLPFSTFNSRQLDEKLQLYRKHLEEHGPPGVLIVGSSRALRGVDPLALEKALAELGYTGIDVFNFGINGATAQVIDLLIRQLLTPDQLPRLIIWADGARAFNSGTVDVTYNGIAVSEGYREVAEGNLPVPPVDGQSADATAARLADASGPSPVNGSPFTASYQDIDRWLSTQLMKVATIYEERDRLKHLIQDWLTLLLPEEPTPSAVLMTAPQQAGNPNNPESRNSPMLVSSEDMMDLSGFLPLSMRFNPATYYQQYARVAGQYDSDYEEFRIEGKQDAAIQFLLQFTQAQGIPVVFVNLPLTQDYLDSIRLEYEQKFKEYMLGIAVNQGGLIFRDLGEQWTIEYDFFSDPSHLNRYGAYQVSKRLAQDPIIPWSQAAMTNDQ
jgi:hypothetical protein